MRITNNYIEPMTKPNRFTQETIGSTFAQKLKIEEAKFRNKHQDTVSPTEKAQKSKNENKKQ